MTEQPSSAAPMTESARLAGIFWEPRPVFADLADRPRWLVPILLLTVLTLAYLISFSRIVGWDTYLEQQMSRRTQAGERLAQLSPEQREVVMDAQIKVVRVMAYVSGVLGVAGSALAVAAVLLGVFRLFGGVSIRFRQVFSIVSYSFLPSGLKTILSLLVLFLKDPADFNLTNPLPSNPGFFLDPSGASAWMRTLATAADVFTIWVLLLAALGLSAAAGKKMTFGRALWLVLLPWLAFTLGSAALAAAFA